MIDIEVWRRRGRDIETLDGRIWAIETGHGSECSVLALHGFPTSSWDFAETIELIAPSRRVITFDFMGYGLSAKPATFGTSLFQQADVAIRVAQNFGITKAHLWAHDMGTSVATELISRRERGLLPFEIASLVLMNGSVHIELASLTLGQKLLKSSLGPLFARLNSRASFKAQMRRVFAKPPTADVLDAMWELLARENGLIRLPALVRYLEERDRYKHRWIGALERLDVPALVAWGRKEIDFTKLNSNSSAKVWNNQRSARSPICPRDL